MLLSRCAFQGKIVYQQRMVCTKQSCGALRAITKSVLAKTNSPIRSVLTAAAAVLNESDEFLRD